MHGGVCQPELVDRLHIAAYGFCAGGHGAVHPGADLYGRAALHIASEAWGDFNRQRQLAVAHAAVQLSVVANRGFFDEIPRAGQIERVIAGDCGLVSVEHRVGKVLHIQADAVSDDEHQDGRAQQGQRGAHRVAAQFQGLALRVAQGTRKAKVTAGRRAG